MTIQGREDLVGAGRGLAKRITPGTPGRASPAWLDNATAKIISRIVRHELEVVPGRRPSMPTADMQARFTPAALSAFRSAGFNGLADSWVRGEWASRDPARFLEHPARIVAEISNSSLLNSAARAYLARTTRWQLGGEREAASANASFHYELPAYLFESFLDESMTYSSAVFDDMRRPDLAAGQCRKRQRIIDLAALGPGAHVLDVGCGWGALLLDLAHMGHSGQGVTLSASQAHYINRVARATSAPITARIADYRDIETGAYDAVFSVEMIEAVGARHLDEYFDRMSVALRRGGRLVIQAIVTAPLRIVMTGRRDTWIRRHVFPGGQLLSRELIINTASRAGLRLEREYEIGEHYALTLALWAERFAKAGDDLRHEGASDQFLRMWQFYLSMCKAGFQGGDMQCLQVAFVKSD